MNIKSLSTLLLLLFALPAWAKDIVWYNGSGNVGYIYYGKRSATVEMALNMFADDMRMVTGRKAEQRVGATIEVFELDKMKDKDFRRLQRRSVPIDKIITKADAFAICTDGGKIVVIGSNANGVAYGILELSRLAGVSPWVWWGDVKPERKHYLAMKDDFLTIQWPSVARRGFLFDEKHINNKHAHELLLRLRGNTMGKEPHTQDGCATFKVDEEWIPATQPGLVYAEMSNAYRMGATQEWLIEAMNPKVAAYPITLFMDMAWNMAYVNATNVQDHYREWLCQQFGDIAGTKLLPIMTEYYHLAGIRKPEEMTVEFVADAFGNELERYIANYADLAAAVDKVTPFVAENLRDAYFEAIEYPIKAAALMAEKQLQAQEARHIGRPQSFAHDEEALYSAVRSWKAYEKLNQLTQQYAQTANGKWADMMEFTSNALITGAPKFPGKLSKDAISRFGTPEPVHFNFDIGNTVTRNASQYRKGSDGTEKIDLLGHSLQAVRIPPAGLLSYSFYSELQGDAVVRIAAIPTQGYGGQDASFSVRIDDGEPQIFTAKSPVGSAQWKTERQRGQAVREIAVKLSRNSHNIEIRALDSPVIIDQIMVDYDPVRAFYMFPISPAIH